MKMSPQRKIQKPTMLEDARLQKVKGGLLGLIDLEGGIFPGGSITLTPTGTRAAWVWTPTGWVFTLV
jgi:hypothetical protein